MANAIQVAPWKISFLPSGNGPYAVKVKLYDLLFSSSNAWYLTDGAGLNLPHDIILFDPAVYVTSGNIIDTAADRDTRQNHGIFLSKVTYDARAPRTWVPSSVYAPLNVQGDPHYGQQGYYIYQSASALPILETDYSTQANKTYYDTSLAAAIFTDLLNPTAPYDGNPTDTTFNPYMCYVSSASAAISGLQAATTSALIISGPDLALQATIPGSSLQAFTKICLRADTSNSEIVSILQFFTGYGIINTQLIPGTSTADLIVPSKNPHLLDVEVWVRCAFFADYVTPTTFEQDLTPGAQVAHENLVVGAGDFKRYTRNAVSVDSPYLPMTPPRNDVLQITAVANAAPFPIPPVTGTYNAATTVSSSPAGWANPELQAEQGSTIIPPGLIAIPTEGNAYASGRIFSPTIDELWIYIKKLVDGQGTGTSISIPAEPAITLAGGNIGDPLNASGTVFVAAPTSFTYSLDPAIVAIANGIIAGIANYAPTVRAVPRANPLSLREIEGHLRNLQFNDQTQIAFFAANMAYAGNTVPAQGTLFQLHKNFNPVNAANTIWPTTPAVTLTATTLPTSSGGYNALADYVAGEVYMGADGQWHYLFDQVRIPVLVETY